MQSPYWDDMGQEQDRSMDALREAILNALMESGQFTAGDARGAARRRQGRRRERREAREAARRHHLEARRGGLPQRRRAAADARGPPAGHRPRRTRARRLEGRAVLAHRERHRLPRLQDPARPPRLPRPLELRQPRHAVPRHRHRGRCVEQAVRVRRHAQPRRERDAAERAHSQRESRRPDRSRLRRPDGAPGRVPLVVRDGADARHVALDDPLRRGSLHAREEGRARAHASHPHAVPRRHHPRRPLPRLGGGDPAQPPRARAGRARITPTRPRGSSSRGGFSCRRRRTCGRS